MSSPAFVSVDYIVAIEELVEVQKEYIELIGAEIDRNVVFLDVHGIRCADKVANKGRELRNKIKELTYKIKAGDAK
jgi:hypothetical protein